MTDANQHPEAPPRLSVEQEAAIRRILEGDGSSVDVLILGPLGLARTLLAELDAVRIDRDQYERWWRCRLEQQAQAEHDRDQWQQRAEALESVLPDPSKLWALAVWIDLKYPYDSNPEVQDDLRRWARTIMGLGLHRGITVKDVLEPQALAAPAPDWQALPSVNLLTGMLPSDREPAPAAAPQDDSSEEWWHASVKAVRSSLELREILLRSVMSSMDLAGLPADRTRSEALLEQALAGPPLIYPGTDQEPAGEGSRQDE